MFRKMILVSLILSITATSLATTIHVPDDQPTIQAGLNAAVENDTVMVAADTYFENIIWPAVNGIKLIGSGEEDCVIDGNQQGSVVRFEPELDGIINDATLFAGFTVSNGNAQGSVPNNFGGGVFCWDATPVIRGVRISENTAYGGGGICSYGSILPLENVAIVNNSADWRGGGIYCNIGAILNQVTVSNNLSETGGGICCYEAEPVLENCILWGNIPQEVLFAEATTNNSITISCSDIQGGEEGIVTNGNGEVFWLENNIEEDPLFCDPDNRDYRLQEDSPCFSDACGFMGYTGETCEGDGVGNIVSEPRGFCLVQNYPNPFNPSTTIEYSLAEPAQIRLSVYNTQGQLVDVIQSGIEQAGQYRVEWAPEDLPSGIYFIELKAGGMRDVLKVSFVK